MSTANRIENVPYFLVVADFSLVLCAALAALPLGPAVVLAPLVVLALLYASGDYSLLVEFRTRARPGIPLACAAFVLAAALANTVPTGAWLLAWNAGGRVAVAAGGCLLLVLVHLALEHFLLAHSQRYVLHLAPGMERAAEALRRHILRSRYPARIVVDAGASPVAALAGLDILEPRRDLPTEPSRIRAVFDPARFCDVVLKVLPPAVLATRPGWAGWERLRPRVYDAVKRGLDLGAASVLLVAAVPLMGLAAAGIMLSDGGPVIFRQARVGRFGRRFRLFKFRTLRQETRVSENPNDGIESRAFGFGALLRRLRLDELPQLVNVLRGDMSLVGPRPEMVYFHQKWSLVVPFYRQRLVVRPGLSGWAQVRFPHTTTETDYWDKTAYDLWYIRHRGPLVDLRIALRTVGVMLFGFGAR
jgi:lipopolysaccharide/colanic/teichoic acid biosynthesis glycosyltransferase